MAYGLFKLESDIDRLLDDDGVFGVAVHQGDEGCECNGETASLTTSVSDLPAFAFVTGGAPFGLTGLLADVVFSLSWLCERLVYPWVGLTLTRGALGWMCYTCIDTRCNT